MQIETKIWKLSEINHYIQTLLREDLVLDDLRVQGEISGFHFHQRSGHMYFSIREGDQILQCVWFNADLANLGFVLEDGLQVVVRGTITTYPNKSQYQLKVTEIAQVGIGTIYQAFENLKKKLFAEGLFEESRKQPIPRFPGNIGLVTSAVGAARRDVEENLKIRYPLAHLIISDAQVQGDGASESIRDALSRLLERGGIDVIIIARGGGSFEDLNAFNDEALARDIVAATVPIISGIGHQKDFTIADFVADIRGGTPSHAVELCTPDISDLSETVNYLDSKMNRLIKTRLEHYRLRVTAAERGSFFRKAENYIERKLQQLDEIGQKLGYLTANNIDALKTKICNLERNLRLINPEAVVDRGFAICYDAKGKLVSNVEAVAIGGEIAVKLKDGELGATVTRRDKND